MTLPIEAARIANTTIRDYIRKEEINVFRNRKLLALLMDRGRVSTGHGGDALNWKVRYKRSSMRGYSDYDTLTFSPVNRWITAEIQWRGYTATDTITKLERLKNKGESAIIKTASQIVENLLQDMDENFGDEIYVDGNASGNSRKVHGIESFMGVTSAATNGYVYTNSDTYAGLNTDLGSYGGSWAQSGGATTWPVGTGDDHYDFWSPLIIKYSDLNWAATTDNWANNCIECLRYAIIHSKRNKSKKGMLDVFVLENDMYRKFLQAYESSQRIVVDRGTKGSLLSLGFTDVTNFDGVDVTSEYGLASGVGYGWAINQVELMSMQDSVFVPEPVDFSTETLSDRFAVSFFGNLKFNPRYFVKLAN